MQLHTLYAVTDKKKDFNEIGPEDFKYWVDWAKEEQIGLDMNPTFFSHPKVKHNFTLASPEKEIRDYWIQVGKKSREISNYFGQELGQKSINNFWIPDGFKDNPIDKQTPRLRLLESLDEIFAKKYDENNTIEAVEGKLFGTGGLNRIQLDHTYFITIMRLVGANFGQLMLATGIQLKMFPTSSQPLCLLVRD